MLKRTLISVALLAQGQAVFAQRAPDAGQQIQQIPAPPIIQKDAPPVVIERAPAASEPAAPGPKILVNTIQLSGQTLFPEAELIAATGFVPGSELSLGDLRALAAQIVQYYNQRGYFLAQAYLPAQDVTDGAVTIAVIEGRYGAIELRNRSDLSDRVARNMLQGLDPGDLVANAPLERRLLLLSDIPGVHVRSTLKPGSEVGTSDLVVDIDQGRKVSGTIEADNGGNRYTGAYRLGGTLYINNPTGSGDLASLRLLASDGGLLYGRAAYQTLVGLASVGVAYAHVDYELGREFKSLDADGTADIFSLFGSYPIIRSRNDNLYGLGAVEAKFLKDRIGATSTVTKRNTRSLTAGLQGDSHDELWGGGWNSFSGSVTFGDLDIETPEARAIDAITARRNGNYGKIQAAAARLQRVTDIVSIYTAVRGQLASKNLDSSEQMQLGGPYGVRAYPEGEAYGDEGYLANAEVRLALPVAAIPGRLQLVGFVEAGSVTFAKNPWYTGRNSADLAGYGAGLLWAAPNNFVVSASYARKIGDTKAVSAPDRSGRFWFQIAKHF